mmetsp:Transcript_58961/g.91732  ORF Transcript_58961/g.91732 Transcript_58961/m.91732 type:complete len:223 (+) Transcript_58961:126-794(+)
MWGGGGMWSPMGGKGGGKGSKWDMWGGSGATYGWGPWAALKSAGKSESGPYSGGGKATGGGATASPSWSKQAAGDLPEIINLTVPDTCPLVAQGYPADVPALEFAKGIGIYSEAHHILQDFFDCGIDEAVTFEHDPECSTFPDVYEAWKAAGQEDNCPTVATCPSMARWAVGFGGKANALRAAKLALALSLATVAEPAKTAEIVSNYPSFGKLLTSAGIEGF